MLSEGCLKVVPKSQNDEDNVTTKTQLTVIGSGGADKSPRALLTLSCLTLPRSMIQTAKPIYNNNGNTYDYMINVNNNNDNDNNNTYINVYL